MRIAHFAPFAPGRCGLYETTRDMVTLEKRLGHQVELVDVGVEGRRHVGATDGDIKTTSYEAVEGFDVFVSHSDVSADFLRRTTAPVVHVMHGRPRSSFLLQQTQPGKSPVYDLVARWAKDARYAAFLTLWREHLPFWRVLVPERKLHSTTAPPCDLRRYSSEGPRHEFPDPTKCQVLVADMWRADADPWHVLHGLMRLDPKRYQVHVYGAQNPLGPWQHVFRRLRRLGLLGEVKGMMRDFDRVLRSADVLVTGSDIATRVVREALAVGTPVVGPSGNQFATHEYKALVGIPNAVARALDYPRFVLLSRFDVGEELIGVYQRALKSVEVTCA